MTPIDKRYTSEEQILMKREIAALRSQMEQIVLIAESGQVSHPMQFQMLQMQLVQMGRQVVMIRQRCQHIWIDEYVISSADLSVSHHAHECKICQLYERIEDEPKTGNVTTA